ncbi:type II toxin-antitoxin system RelE/ParE family toxin [Weeksellaceae bacterium TAE3-ERU29]|nr:type II toxin-antitoxin system RelE/ParE family toxin [Weeksellaceae bacterium TAE3-ERU29]
MLRVEWSNRALKEFLDTLEYWKSHNLSSQYSEKIRQAVSENIKAVQITPYIGKKIANKSIRKINFLSDFSLVYSVDESSIKIISFWDGRRCPNDLKI